MKLELTEKDYRAIFELAHREWLADTDQSRYKTRPDQYLLARSYFKAVVAFLGSKGYTIEKKNDEKQNKG